MVKLELAYLKEIKKINPTPDHVINVLSKSIGLEVAASHFPHVIAIAQGLHWTRDAFDRIIVAEAKLHSAPLVTRDKNILRHYSLAVW